MTLGKSQKWVWRGNNQFLLIYIPLGLSLTFFSLSHSSKHMYDYGKEAKVAVEWQQQGFYSSTFLWASL